MPTVALNEPAPDFTLNDYLGNPTSLSQFKGQKNVLLVFNRGFLWPFCQAHMAQLRQSHKDFINANTEILVVGPENAAAFKKYFKANKLAYRGLPDPQHTVLKLYGQQIKIFKWGRMPAQLLIDIQGIVRFVCYGNSMSDIPTPESMLERIAKL